MSFENSYTAFTGAAVGGMVSPTLLGVLFGAVMSVLFFDMVKRLQQ